MIITANQKTDTVNLPDHDLGCSALRRTYAFHDDHIELFKLRVSTCLRTSGFSWNYERYRSTTNNARRVCHLNVEGHLRAFMSSFSLPKRKSVVYLYEAKQRV